MGALEERRSPGASWTTVCVVVAMCLFVSAPALALSRAEQEQGEDEALVIFFDEEEIVFSPSRKQEQLAAAPAIVTVITSEQIQRRGYRTLAEILADAVGFEINDNLHWPDTGVRGINERTTYGDKILILIDGHAMAWRQFNRNYHNESWFRPNDVKRIELIRGPGSALWGGGALLGVVNIITVDADEFHGAEVTVGGGLGHDEQQVTARAGAEVAPGLHVGATVAVTQRGDDGLLAPLREFTDLGVQGGEGATGVDVFGQERDSQQFTLRARYHDLSFLAQFSRFAASGPLSTFSVFGGDDTRFVHNRFFSVLRFQREVAEGLDLELELHVDDARFGDGTAYEANPLSEHLGSSTGGGAGVDNWGQTFDDGRFLRAMAARDDRVEARAKLSWAPCDWFDGAIGGEAEYLDATRWHFPELWRADATLEEPRIHQMRYAAYLQSQLKLGRWLYLTLGGRYDHTFVLPWSGDEQGRDFMALSPRAGLTILPGLGFYIKALYGLAFKPPSLHDLYYFRRDAFYGDPGLKPELSTTGELQLGYRYQQVLDLRLSAYHIFIDDLIGYQQHAAGDPLDHGDAFPSTQLPSASGDYSQKANSGRIRSTGAELELRLSHGPFTLDADATLRRAAKQNGASGEWVDLDYSSSFVAGASIGYALLADVTLHVAGRYFGARSVPARGYSSPGAPVSWTAATDPTTRAPAYVDTSMTLRARRVVLDKLDLSLRISNLLNQQAYDAGREILYPRRMLNMLLVGTYRF